MAIPIKEFYEVRRSTVDLSELDNYLVDMMSNIEKELDSNLKMNYNMHLSQFGTKSNNWRFRKNHNFMDQYSSHDKILLDMNYEINKITGANYQVIGQKVKKIMEENTSSEENTDIFMEYILDSVFTNCIEQPMFCQFYLNFLTEITSSVVWDNYIVDFLKLLDYTSDKMVDNELISGKNKKAVKNIGLFYGQLYNKNHFTISHKSLLNKIFKYYTHLVDLLNQTPLDEVEFEIRLNLMIGFMEIVQHKLWTTAVVSDRLLLEEKMSSLINHNEILLRCKFAIQDLLDAINKMKPVNNINPVNNTKKFDVRETFKKPQVPISDEDGWERVVRKKPTVDKKRQPNGYRNKHKI